MKAFFCAVLTAMLFVGCSKDVHDMTPNDTKALSETERKELMKQLNGEEMGLMMKGMLALRKEDSATVKNMTIGEIIEEGRKAQELRD